MDGGTSGGSSALNCPQALLAACCPFVFHAGSTCLFLGLLMQHVLARKDLKISWSGADQRIFLTFSDFGLICSMVRRLNMISPSFFSFRVRVIFSWPFLYSPLSRFGCSSAKSDQPRSSSNCRRFSCCGRRDLPLACELAGEASPAASSGSSEAKGCPHHSGEGSFPVALLAIEMTPLDRVSINKDTCKTLAELWCWNSECNRLRATSLWATLYKFWLNVLSHNHHMVHRRPWR